MLCLLSVALVLVSGSPFDAHVQPVDSSSPFFEGWYTKLNDFEHNLSWALILGSFQPPHWSQAAQFKFHSHWMAFMYFPPNPEQSFTSQIVFTDEESPVTVKVNHGKDYVRSNPVAEAPVDFVWTSESHGSYVVDDDVTTIDLRYNDIKINFKSKGRVPWSKAEPNADSPEGWLRHFTAMLPCHYAVHSLASPSEYSLEIGEHHRVSGKGLSHMETNYGDIFPKAWTWAQGISASGKEQFVLTGGKFQIGPIISETWVVAYRSENYEWNFRPTELDFVSSSMDACAGVLNVTAVSLSADRKVVVHITTPVETFSDKLYFPTVEGFSNDPGCHESFYSTVKIEAYERTGGFWHLSPKYELKEETFFWGAALEFGGDFLCHEENTK